MRKRYNVDVATEFYKLAQGDEQAGLILLEADQSRHAMYLIIQAMEKYVRAKIFSIINSKHDAIRQANYNHSVEEAVDTLVEVMNAEERIKQQVRTQFAQHVFNTGSFGYLHNDLRYPFYSKQHQNFSCIDEITRADADAMVQKLKFIKTFLTQFDKM